MSTKKELKDLMVLANAKESTVSVSDGVRVSVRIGCEILLEADSITNYLKFQEEFGPLVTVGRRSSRTASPEPEWDLNLGWEGHQEMLTKGWAEGVQKLKLAQANFPQTPSFGKVPDTDIAGGSLCVATFCSGAPDHYDIDPEDESLGDAKVVKLVIPIGATAGYEASYLFNRGAGIVSAINAIERSGKQCEVWAESASKDYGSEYVIGQRVLIKWAGSPLDLNNLAVWIAHPATFRRLFFSGRECLWGFKLNGRSVYNMLSGYGGTCMMTASGLKEGTIYLPTAERGNYSTAKSTMETLTGLFKSAGFTLDFGDLSNL